MLDWFKCNSAALQGIAAVLSAVFTLVIIAVTLWYVRLTRTIAEATHQQLSASLQPVLRLDISTAATHGEGVAFDKRSYWSQVNFVVQSKGSAPLKLKGIYVVIQHWSPTFVQYEQEATQKDEPYKDIILMPQDQVIGQPIADLREQWSEDMVFGLRVDCTDMSELELHSFVFRPGKGVKHSVSPGFRRQPTFWQRVEKASQYVRKWAEWENSESDRFRADE
jgi:hypothetical protein